jgi:hypothetical protein
MVHSTNIIVFIIFYFSVQIFYFIIIATSQIKGDNSNSCICVDKNNKPPTGIGIGTHSGVFLEMNTHMGTLDYFVNNNHIKDRVVNVLKDVYFGV